MSLPYEAPFIAKLLRAMPPGRLAAVEPRHFQTWPAVKVIPSAAIADLIRNELTNRRLAR